MSATGGSIQSVALGGREFPVAADSDSSRKLGGYENEVQPNGDGTVRVIKSRVAWSIDGLNIQIDDSRDDAEFLQALANRTDTFQCAITYVSGISYGGQGALTGEMPTSSQNTTAPISLMGRGTLTKL